MNWIRGFRQTAGMGLSLLSAVSLFMLASGCTTTLPDPKITRYGFPKDRAFVGDVKRPYKKLGQVRTKVNFNTLDWVHEEDDLCKNFYNKGVRDLVARAREQGADAVIDVRSVVFSDLGGPQTFQTPECSDEGDEGQILLEGIAVKWIPPQDLKRASHD